MNKKGEASKDYAVLEKVVRQEKVYREFIAFLYILSV